MGKPRDKKWLIALAVTVLAVAGAAAWAYPYFKGRAGHEAMLHIRPGVDADGLLTLIGEECGSGFAGRTVNLLEWMDCDIANRDGAYKVSADDTPLSLARKIRNRQQTPVRLTFNNVRLKSQLAERVSEKLMMSGEELMSFMNDSAACASLGKDTCNVVNLFIPDTYECYWNASAEQLARLMAHYHNLFWEGKRDEQAKRLGLTRDQVHILASIVEEETAKADEMGMVARLYLNRLERGMLLQADPTVKYAMRDFTIRRVTNAMLKTDSPYNTYMYAGLPPGPIRFASKRGIDAVLNAPQHGYLYMCAKEDFSGYHNFASTYSRHIANARRYQAELNRRGIR